jgi:hypothetical protein
MNPVGSLQTRRKLAPLSVLLNRPTLVAQNTVSGCWGSVATESWPSALPEVRSRRTSSSIGGECLSTGVVAREVRGSPGH